MVAVAVCLLATHATCMFLCVAGTAAWHTPVMLPVNAVCNITFILITLVSLRLVTE